LINGHRGAKVPAFPLLKWVLLLVAVSVASTGLAALIVPFLTTLMIWVGMMIYIIPNTLFIFYVYRHRGARNAKRIVDATYLGEGIKFLLTGALFAAVFVTGDPSVTPWSFAGYVVAMILGWIGSVWLQRS